MNFLEGHLFGDPTFRFAPIEANTLSTDITIHKNDKAYWENPVSYTHLDVYKRQAMYCRVRIWIKTVIMKPYKGLLLLLIP